MQPLMTIGTVLQNRYRLIKILSQGATESTYLAEDQGRFNEICTLRELTLTQCSAGGGSKSASFAAQTDSDLEKSKELFQQEATHLCQLQHPQVPQFRASFEQDQRLFLVQEYVEGKTYTTLLDERQAIGQTFTEAEVLQLFEQLLPVLEYLHSQGVIHRDISPDNIILRERDHLPVLTNFGSIKEIATQFLFPLTYQLIAIGRLGYVPAEQIQTGRAYPSSDLYAFAVTSVVLLTGQKPQALFDATQLAWNWQPWVTLSPELDQVLHRMLSYKPSDRYQSGAAVLQALQLSLTPTFQEATASDSVSWQQSVIAHHPAAIEASTNQPDQLESVLSVSKDRKPWDNRWVMAIMFLLVTLVPGISAWLLVSSRLSPSHSPVPSPASSPQAFPSPLISGTTSPTSPSSSDETSSGSNTTPTSSTEPVKSSQHLNLRAGKKTIVRGSLKAPVDYTFQGEQGQQLSATLTAEDVLLSIWGPDQTPIDGSANQVTHYQGQLPATGVYTIELRPAEGIVRSKYRLILHLANPA